MLLFINLLNHDHYVISFNPQYFLTSNARSKSCYVFDYSRADYKEICSYLIDVDFNVCLLSNDIEFIWFTIKSFIFVFVCS